MRKGILFLGIVFALLIAFSINAIDYTPYDLYDSFSNVSNGDNISAVEYGFEGWFKTSAVQSCKYYENTSACGTPDEGSQAFLYNVTATSSATCRVDVFVDTNTSANANIVARHNTKNTAGSDVTSWSINQNGIISFSNFTPAGGTPSPPTVPVNTTWRIWSYVNQGTSCKYYILQLDDYAVNYTTRDAGCAQTVDSMNFTSIAGENTLGRSYYDNVSCWTGKPSADPDGWVLGTINIIEPADGSYIGTQNLSLNVTTDNTVDNITYILNNGAENILCTSCSSYYTNDFTPVNFGFHRIDVRINGGAESAFTNFTYGSILSNVSTSLVDINNFNITFYDESTNLPLSVAVDANFIATISNYDRNSTIYYHYTNDTEIPVWTINQPSLSMITRGNFEVSATGYNSRTFINEYNMTTTFQNINLYLLPTASAATITFTLVDNVQNPLQGLQLEAYRWNIDDTYTLVESGISDISGQVRFSLDQTKQYKYLVKRNGVIVKEIDKFIPIQTSYTFTVDIELPKLTKTVIDLSSLTYNLSYSNNTMFLHLDWTSPTVIVSQHCLMLTNRTVVSNMNEINTICSPDQTGTIDMDLTGHTNTSILTARYFVIAERNGQQFTVDEIDIDMRESYRIFGWIGIILLITIGMVFIFGAAIDRPVILIVSGMLFMLVLFMSGIVGGIGWGVTIAFIFLGGMIIFFMKS